MSDKAGNWDHTFYLAFKRKPRGSPLSVRVAQRQPSLETGEISIEVHVSLPKALFVRPMLKATITVPEDSVSPAVVDADVADNIAETIRQNLGLDMKISIPANESAA